ncbi:CASP8 and FADD-like apoptosis regulator isoform X1 [Triplophysa rosa]|uniref:CASP8 and FADD-like apoptosis regulator isoform X1 n=1 Tax=Triplophysa rosa TaxID=992332 RepID=UPI002545DA30|nr:CASP8 and FADD-like apoptosis regulator isoform X1 [Triplophysa rosa]
MFGDIISQITDELSTDECKRLFYLCGALHADTCTTDLRTVLHSVLCRMTNTDHVFLTELMLRIKRYDLLRDVLSTSKGTVEGMLENSGVVSEYRVLMADVSEDMDTHDLKSLTFLLRDTLPKHKVQNIQSFLDIVVELEKVEQLSSDKTDRIEHLMRSIHRADLAKKIRHYQQKVLNTKRETSPAVKQQLNTTASVNHSLDISSSVSCNVTRQVHKLCDKRTAVRKETPGVCSQQIEVYSMQTDPRGVCLIIDCIGTETDVLEKTFTCLHFRVMKHKLLSVRDVLAVLMDVAHQRDLYSSCAFICCMISLSRRSSHLLDTDHHGPGLNLDTIRHLFTADSCPGLAGKPKLFFIQTYDVSEPQRCVGFRGHEDGELETDGPAVFCRARSVPTDADIFWSHCCSQEKQPKTPEHPSVYLNALTSALHGGHIRRTHLLDAHTAVNREVFKHNSKFPGSSVLNLKHTLRKNMYL